MITMMAAALVGSGVANAGTWYSAAPGSEDSCPPDEVFGNRASDENVSGASLHIFADDNPDHEDDFEYACGGKTNTGAANGNNVTMTGGSVRSLYAGYSNKGSGANNNKIVITNGKVKSELFVGVVNTGNGTASGNKLIITGGEITAQNIGAAKTRDGDAQGNFAYITGGTMRNVYGGYATNNGASKDNQVHLVGVGASITVDGEKYDGQQIQVSYAINAGYSLNGSESGNSIEIYGTGISAMQINHLQLLNFHIVGTQASDDAPMLSLTSIYEESTMIFGEVELGFYGDGVKNWGAFDGKSITLVSAATAITIGEGSLGDVEIKGVDGATVATATLGLANENKSLVLSNIKGTAPIPEPTTGTLSLLALAGLCARRRK